MATDSTAAGFIAPGAPLPDEDQPLLDLMQAAIVGITGLPGSLVRPRWQPRPPVQPDFDVNWCAFGINRRVEDVHAAQSFDPAGTGSMVVERDETLYVLHSFYGPEANRFCKLYRTGLDLEQNRAQLKAGGLVLQEVTDTTNLPALLKEQWVPRIDTTVIYRRRASYRYPVRSILSGQLGLDNEYWVTPIFITNP